MSCGGKVRRGYDTNPRCVSPSSGPRTVPQSPHGRPRSVAAATRCGRAAALSGSICCPPEAPLSISATPILASLVGEYLAPRVADNPTMTSLSQSSNASGAGKSTLVNSDRPEAAYRDGGPADRRRSNPWHGDTRSCLPTRQHPAAAPGQDGGITLRSPPDGVALVDTPLPDVVDASGRSVRATRSSTSPTPASSSQVLTATLTLRVPTSPERSLTRCCHGVRAQPVARHSRAPAGTRVRLCRKARQHGAHRAAGAGIGDRPSPRASYRREREGLSTDAVTGLRKGSGTALRSAGAPA